MSSSLVPDAKPLAGPKPGLRNSSGNTRVCAVCVCMYTLSYMLLLLPVGCKDKGPLSPENQQLVVAGGRVTGYALGHPYKRKCLSPV